MSRIWPTTILYRTECASLKLMKVVELWNSFLWLENSMQANMNHAGRQKGASRCYHLI